MEDSSPSTAVDQQHRERGWWSTPGISRRPVNSTNTSSSRTRAPPPPVIHPDIDPPPTPRPLAQFLAFGLILFFAFLQFLPATHFRDPSDPFRSWIPYDHSSSSSSRAPNGEVASPGVREVGTIHVVSWVDCLDLRMLAVLANSTLSNSRYPEHIHFHFFTPEGNADKVSYYKLKVLFPHSNLEILGQEEVKQKLGDAVSVGEYTTNSIHELAPFIIPITHPSLSRFIYVSPDIILKGSIEEIFETDLGNYGIAATEDCSKHLSDYLSFDVLDAIQRVSAKPWVSTKPYERTACTPNLDVLLISASKLEKDILESILWWSKLLNSQHQRNAKVLSMRGLIYDVPKFLVECVTGILACWNFQNDWFDGPGVDGSGCTRDQPHWITVTHSCPKVVAVGKKCIKEKDRLNRDNQISPAVAVALYGKYLKLSTTWIVSDSTPQKLNDAGVKVLRFDGPRNLCSPEHENDEIQHLNFGNLWKQYLPPISSSILVS